MTTTKTSSKQKLERIIRANNPETRQIHDAFNQPFWATTNPAALEGHSQSFLKLRQLWIDGHVGIVTLPSLGCQPFADKARAENQAALQRLSLLDGPRITAEVFPDQNNHSPDGNLRWDGPLLTLAAEPGNPSELQWFEHACPPGAAPLEIGSCAGDTVLMRLTQCGAVARWPYGSDSVVVIVEIERGHITNTVANSYLPPLSRTEPEQ